MDWIIELLKMTASAAAGGGAMWLFNFRLRVRRQGNELEGQDFELVSKTVKQAMRDLSELSERIGELEREKATILEDMNALRKQNKHLEGILRQYIKDNNPNLLK